MTSPRPVYILGTDALACYLAAKFQDADQPCSLIASPSDIQSLGTNGATIKEEFSTLKKKHYKFDTAFWGRSEPLAVIITATSSEVNSVLSGITPDNIYNAPIICFSLLKDSGYLKDILGSNFHKADFSGWLNKNDQQIILRGRQPHINIYSPASPQSAKSITKLFAPLGLEVNFAQSENSFFWPMFALRGACSLMCTAYDKPLSQILKNKPLTLELETLLEEFRQLAAVDNILLSTDSVMQNIINIPGGYIFPLHADFRSGRHRDFNTIYEIINQTARRGNLKLPHLNELLTRIYEIYLSIT